MDMIERRTVGLKNAVPRLSAPFRGILARAGIGPRELSVICCTHSDPIAILQSRIATTCTAKETNTILRFAELARSRLADAAADDDCADADSGLRLWQLNAILAFENRPTAPITPRDDFVMGLFRERDALAAAQ